MDEPVLQASGHLPDDYTSIHEGLAEEIRAYLKENRISVIVLDDDPTGTQTVHGVPVLTVWGGTRVPTETGFYNNIFYFEDKGDWGFEPDETCVFGHNLYVNISPKEDHALTDDPLFENPGTGATDIDMTDPDRLSGYQLKQGSPAINAGKVIQNSGDIDFRGNGLDESPDIGAFEKK